MHEGHHGILDDLEDMDDLFGSEKEPDENGNPVKKQPEKQGDSRDHKHGHGQKDDPAQKRGQNR